MGGSEITFVSAPGGGGDSPTPVLFGIGNQIPGAAVASFVNEGLATMTPVPSLFDGAPIQSIYWQALAGQGGVLLAGVTAEATTFLGHDLSLIYRSTDGGQTWVSIATPWDADIGMANTYITAVAFGNGGDVMLMGLVNDEGVAGWSTDYGQTWTDITADVPADLGSTIAFDGTTWYIVAGDSAPFLHTSATPLALDSWVGRTTGIDDEGVAYVVATSTVAIAVGGATTNTMAISTDGGVTWTESTNPFDGTGPATVVIPDGAGNWLAWNPAGLGIGAMVQSLDDGATWGTPVDLPAFATQVASCFLSGTGWVTVWGTATGTGVVIIYSAPVADPLVITPTGYAPDNVYAPLALVPIS